MWCDPLASSISAKFLLQQYFSVNCSMLSTFCVTWKYHPPHGYEWINENRQQNSYYSIIHTAIISLFARIFRNIAAATSFWPARLASIASVYCSFRFCQWFWFLFKSKYEQMLKLNIKFKYHTSVNRSDVVSTIIGSLFWRFSAFIRSIANIVCLSRATKYLFKNNSILPFISVWSSVWAILLQILAQMHRFT